MNCGILCGDNSPQRYSKLAPAVSGFHHGPHVHSMDDVAWDLTSTNKQNGGVLINTGFPFTLPTPTLTTRFIKVLLVWHIHLDGNALVVIIR